MFLESLVVANLVLGERANNKYVLIIPSNVLGNLLYVYTFDLLTPTTLEQFCILNHWFLNLLSNQYRSGLQKWQPRHGLTGDSRTTDFRLVDGNHLNLHNWLKTTI